MPDTIRDAVINEAISANEFLESIKRLTKDLKTAAVTLSDREARFLVDAYYAMQRDRIRAGHQNRTLEQNKEPHDVLTWLQAQRDTLEKQIARALDAYSDSLLIGRWARSQVGIGPIIAAGLACHIDIEQAPTVGHIWRFAGLDPTVQWKPGQKRPWNGALKRLCFLIGESFVKVSGNDEAVYGLAYAVRKAREIEKNERLEFKDQAERALAEKRWRDDTQAKKHYEAGKLPPARIHMRAKRWSVKLFLSNYHEVLYFSTFGKLPPLPYIMAKDPLLHTHFVEPPNADMVPGLSEARRAFRQGQV